MIEITKDTILHTIDIKCKNGKYGEFYEITFVTENGDAAVTYIDPSYTNWWKWARIVNQPDVGVILTGCTHKKRRREPQYTSEGFPIVNGDSLPEVLLELPMTELIEEVAIMVADQNKELFIAHSDDDPFEESYY